MFVIVEGIDRVGKTTLCNRLENNGFIILKDAFGQVKATNEKQQKLLATDSSVFPAYSLGKLDTAVQYIKALCDKGYNIVVDRLHLTEMVYGFYDRPSMPLIERVKILDRMIDEMFGTQAMLVLVKPTDIEAASERAERDLSSHAEYFEVLFNESCIPRRIETDFYHLDDAVKEIVSASSTYDFYFASPFFRPDQVEREERLKRHLRLLGYKVFSPKEQCHLTATADSDSQEAVFSDNVSAIRSSAAVFAVTDTKDMGTIWEAGFAYATGKPIIYYAETLGDNQFNVMLAKSGRVVCTSMQDLTKERIDEVVYSGKNFIFEGVIE